jgi:phage baseplate assembly protein W
MKTWSKTMAKKFLGLQYPLVKGPRGLLAQKNGVDQIKADLLQLLLTNPGERVMLPSFGVPLRTLVFEQNEDSLAVRARQMIADAIVMWEPRVVITDIRVTTKLERENMNPLDTGEEAESVLYIQIDFVDPQNISEVEQLALTVPIGD